MSIRAVLFDFGDTLIVEQRDDHQTLDQMQLEPFPEASSALERLHKNYRLVLLTNTALSSTDSVRKALRNLGFAPFFSLVVTSHDAGAKKPHPTMFRSALQHLKIEPHEAVMVGNDPVNDISGARSIGINTILLDRDGEYDHVKGLADRTAQSLDAVASLVESWTHETTRKEKVDFLRYLTDPRKRTSPNLEKHVDKVSDPPDREFYWTWIWNENNLFTNRANFFLIAEAMLLAGIATLLSGDRGTTNVAVFRLLVAAGFLSTALWIYVSALQLHRTINPLKRLSREVEPRYAHVANRQGRFASTNFLVGLVLPIVLEIVWIGLLLLAG